MGILVQDNGQRTKLQDRISADLQEKNRPEPRQDDTDLVEDSEYTKQLKQTGRFSWVWFLLIMLAIVSVVVILVI